MPKKDIVALSTETSLSSRAKKDEARHSSESGDDHDLDDDHDEYNHEHDDHDQEQDDANDSSSAQNNNSNNRGNSNDSNNVSHTDGDEAAPIKRKRLTQACDPCRKKKIKCDGVKPSCANCTKLNGNCTYLPSMKKRGPRQGYIELLEKRLDKMEQLLQHGSAAIDPELLDSKSILNSRLRPGSRHSASPSASGAAALEEGTSVSSQGASNRTRGDPEERYFGTTSGYSSQYAEYDKQNDPIKGAVGLKYSSQRTLPHSKDQPKNPLYGIRDEIPRKDILDHLIDLFFDSIYFQLPIIHPVTFRKQYREGKISPNLLNAMCAVVARFSNHPDVVTTPAFLAGEPFATNVRGMLLDSIDIPTVSNVQALVFLSMYEYGAARGPRAWMLGGMAVRQAQELGLNREDSSPVFHLKGDWVMRETRRRTFWACFILDVLASSSSGRPRMMDERDCEVLLPSEDHDWCNERPVVTEMLHDGEDSLGNDHGPTTGSEISREAEAQLKETTLTGEPGSSHATVIGSLKEQQDAAASSTMPPSSAKIKEQDAGHSLSSFAYLIRIVAVLGKVSQYVNRPRSKKAIPPNQRGSEFSVIDAALTAWHQSIPLQLAYSLENAKMVKDKGEGCIIVFMHVIYHTAVVLLHRPILAADKASFPLDSMFVENSVVRCANAASKVSDVLEFVQAYNCPPRIFISAFFAYPVFTTATIHITNAFVSDATVAARARRSLSIHVKILQIMKPYWSIADKFFYIIRDLYSIQSKISSSGSKMNMNHMSSQATPASQSTKASTGVEGSSEAPAPAPEAKGADPNSSSGTNSKVASITSFLKSDSGLVALWRRATEMQVLDEAKQEQRRLSMSEESNRQPVSLEERKELHPEDRALQEHRQRMNALEIQQINQEFDRRWRSKEEGSASSEREENNLTEGSSLSEKRHKDEESLNPKGAKQAKTVKGSKASKTSSRKIRPQTPPDTREIVEENQSINTQDATSVYGTTGGDAAGISQTTYRHAILQQPPQLQLQDSYILQPMQIQPNPESPAATHGVSAVPSRVVNGQVLNLYSQQQQDALDMAQNANIQQQQQQLRLQQDQAAQMSSLTFGPPNGFPPSFLSPTAFQGQQGFSPQGLGSGAALGLPLVYGSNYDGSQAQRLPTESLGSLFDFALPQGDISFLSNSFQVTPMMMQESTGFGRDATMVPSRNNTGSGTLSDDMGSITAAASTSSTISGSGSASTPSSRPLEAQSPSSDPSNLFNISPRLRSFLMSDEPYPNNSNNNYNSNNSSNAGAPHRNASMNSSAGGSMQATPTNLIRYLQLHHQQEMQQQEMQQQQNMQPVLNQQNSLIYDDYFPWNQLSYAPPPQ
ncbi:hypothetical protein EDD11_009684 [Mortierella claussenii]|nr:hypothetical protein EDD11_009684 [Mortierella claussenii]